MKTAILAAAVSVSIALAQEPLKESGQPSFRAQTNLVVVPFQVRRGSRPVSDLTASDVVLREDGRPRAFTGFDAPSDHPSLELVVMFDVTDRQRGGFWTAGALRELAGVWTGAMARALIEESGAAVRISVYQLDHSRLRRLVRATSDPGILLEALGRLSEPIPDEPAFALTLPPGAVMRDRKGQDGWAHPTEPWAWSLAAANTVLRDSVVEPGTVRRALVMFSPGGEATSLTPQQLADQAIAADVPVYPVALPSNHAIWYEDSPPAPLSIRTDPAGGPNTAIGGARSQWGICEVERRGRPPVESELLDCPLNAPFEHVGTQTGGGSFEATRHPGFPKLPHIGKGLPLDRFSMTTVEVNDILHAVQRHALARFNSTYRVWFTPSSSASPRKHTLEVSLRSDSGRKVMNGKRSVTY